MGSLPGHVSYSCSGSLLLVDRILLDKMGENPHVTPLPGHSFGHKKKGNRRVKESEMTVKTAESAQVLNPYCSYFPEADPFGLALIALVLVGSS
jgi:hypothetical protein